MSFLHSFSHFHHQSNICFSVLSSSYFGKNNDESLLAINFLLHRYSSLFHCGCNLLSEARKTAVNLILTKWALFEETCTCGALCKHDRSSVSVNI